MADAARRMIILNTIDDVVIDFVEYDRREDPELARGEIEAAIEAGEISLQEIRDRFAEQLTGRLNRA